MVLALITLILGMTRTFYILGVLLVDRSAAFFLPADKQRRRNIVSPRASDLGGHVSANLQLRPVRELTVKELKIELQRRGIEHRDLYERNVLERRVEDSRASFLRNGGVLAQSKPAPATMPEPAAALKPKQSRVDGSEPMAKLPIVETFSDIHAWALSLSEVELREELSRRGLAAEDDQMTTRCELFGLPPLSALNLWRLCRYDRAALLGGEIAAERIEARALERAAPAQRGTPSAEPQRRVDEPHTKQSSPGQRREPTREPLPSVDQMDAEESILADIETTLEGELWWARGLPRKEKVGFFSCARVLNIAY